MSSISQFVYRIQPTRFAMLTEGPTPEEAEIISQHFDRLEALMEQGVVILAGRTLNSDPTTFGIVIFNAESEDFARAIMESDPAVSGGVMRAELFPYRVALISEANAR
jgi:uncharacterized protein YciI